MPRRKMNPAAKAAGNAVKKVAGKAVRGYLSGVNNLAKKVEPMLNKLPKVKSARRRRR